MKRFIINAVLRRVRENYIRRMNLGFLDETFCARDIIGRTYFTLYLGWS